MLNVFAIEEKLLIDTKELAERLTLSRKKARAFCMEHGVNPINVSPAAARPTWRWRVESVIAMLDTLEPEGQAEDYIPRDATCPSVMGRSAKDLFRELSTYKEVA